MVYKWGWPELLTNSDDFFQVFVFAGEPTVDGPVIVDSLSRYLHGFIQSEVVQDFFHQRWLARGRKT